MVNAGAWNIAAASAVVALGVAAGIRLRSDPVHAVLRFALSVVVALFVLSPVVRTAAGNGRPAVAVLVDTSASMGFLGRMDRVRRMLERHGASLRAGADVVLYAFDEELRAVTGVDALTATPRGTSLPHAIAALRARPMVVDTVLIFSDGADNRRDLPDIAGFPGTLVPVLLRDPPFVDVAVARVRASDIGFKDVPYELAVDVHLTGTAAADIRVSVHRGDDPRGETLASRTVAVPEGRTTVNLSFTPRITGRMRFSVHVRPVAGELTVLNNTMVWDADIRKNKVRILYLCGAPSSEYFFLRNLIKSDPTMELVSFIILRENEDTVIVPDEDIALIPFPIHEIFVKDLAGYDTVIFHDFTWRGYGIPVEYLENIRRHVLTGNGFIMIGGERSFGLGGYGNTPIADLLPVTLLADERYDSEPFIAEPVNPRDRFIRSPDGPEDTAALWKGMPVLEGRQLLGERPGTTVLLRHPKDRLPVVAVWERGKGRVVACGTSSTWRWALGSITSRRADDVRSAYRRFWRSLLAWSAGAESLGSLEVLTDGLRYAPDETVRVRVHVADAPEPGAGGPEAWVDGPDGVRRHIGLEEVSPTEFRGTFTPGLEGRHTLTVANRVRGATVRAARDITVAPASAQELSALGADHGYLGDVAALAGSEPVREETFDPAAVLSVARERAHRRSRVAVYPARNPLLGVLFLLLLMADTARGRLHRGAR